MLINSQPKAFATAAQPTGTLHFVGMKVVERP